MGPSALRVLLVVVVASASLGLWPSLLLLRQAVVEARRTRGWQEIHRIVARGHLRSGLIRVIVLCLFVSDAVVLLRVPSNHYVLPYEMITAAFMLVVAVMILAASLLDLNARRVMRASMTDSEVGRTDEPRA